MRRPIALLILILAIVPCSAAPASQTLFGHRVEIERDARGLVSVLKVDGKTLHHNAIISIDEVTTVGGVGVAIGSSSAGGNACDGSPFVLAFPPKKRPRFAGPLKNCKTVTYEIKPDGLRFESKALEGDDGEAWTWTPASGLRSAGAVKHAPDPTRGWNDLGAAQAPHPSELLDLGEVAPSLLALLGKDRKDVLPLINGVGSGSLTGDMYVGTACRPHACPDAGVLVIADLNAKKVYVAWKLEKRKTQVRGPIADWPKAAGAELDKWMTGWDPSR